MTKEIHLYCDADHQIMIHLASHGQEDKSSSFSVTLPYSYFDMQWRLLHKQLQGVTKGPWSLERYQYPECYYWKFWHHSS